MHLLSLVFHVEDFPQRSGGPRGAWLAQLVKPQTLAQVMISHFVSSSPALDSVLIARSLEPASDCVSFSLLLPDLCSLSLSLSLSLWKTNKRYVFFLIWWSLAIHSYFGEWDTKHRLEMDGACWLMDFSVPWLSCKATFSLRNYQIALSVILFPREAWFLQGHNFRSQSPTQSWDLLLRILGCGQGKGLMNHSHSIYRPHALLYSPPSLFALRIPQSRAL